jgi:hypothetical protein
VEARFLLLRFLLCFAIEFLSRMMTTVGLFLLLLARLFALLRRAFRRTVARRFETRLTERFLAAFATNWPEALRVRRLFLLLRALDIGLAPITAKVERLRRLAFFFRRFGEARADRWRLGLEWSVMAFFTAS